MWRLIILIGTFNVFLFSCTESDQKSSDSKPQFDSSAGVKAVIEIPAGTLDKFELSKSSGKIEHEKKDGKPRVVQYLSYPGNYGYIPNTLLSKKNGGDGDPLDVIVLGASVNRNDTIDIKVIGALKLLDRGEQDDKLIAVSQNTPFSQLDDLADLNSSFPGVSEIIDIWFTNYKGLGKMETQGFMDKDAAVNVLNMAKQDYQKSIKE